MEWINYENSFNGVISSIPYIAVDNFYDKSKRAYFLSHFHSDHYGGLVGDRESNSQTLKEKNPTIYMSKITEIILKHSYPRDYDKLQDLIVTLETGIVTKIEVDNYIFDVTLIPVDHMPGAVMFLFYGAFGNNNNVFRIILYTGDFVITKENLYDAYPALHEEGRPIRIDEMYCDDTHEQKFSWGPKTLPLRHKILSEVIELIQNWLDSDEKKAVVIHSNYKYGYEDLFRAVSNATKQSVAIDDLTRLQAYSEIYGEDNIFTGEPSRIAHNSSSDDSYRVSSVIDEKCTKVMYIKAKLYNTEVVLEKKAYGVEPSITFNLNYPLHCSRLQLDQFVDYFGKDAGVPTYFPKKKIISGQF